ncbi:LexA/Signal peptidase [Trematosphaeria pertusa]|uniref:Mitochondrial inner membrane protease subunit n=1 Tax=Trematosphaeria pertusa TaxID=390896 RepID=A0A6A6ILN1_9PLEO|nr:LexA/Signal peptidase [Trematosphaeria pertusa]KAF2250978.1 LexA/Signal peptidase [Trematosphaeria pertusa]
MLPPRLRIPSHLPHLRVRPQAPSARPILRPSTRPLYSNAAPAPPPHRPWTIILYAYGGLLTVHTFISYIGSIGPTHGVSMVPTISHGYLGTPLILESRLHRRGRNIHVGDIITYVHPVNPSTNGCKRVIGMPGDFVSVVTPGRRDEDLGKADKEGEWARVRDEVIRVPEGHCWVAGDNLEWSRDSRVFGAVPLALVRGKVIAVLWPWGDRKWFGGRGGLEDAREEERDWVAG